MRRRDVLRATGASVLTLGGGCLATGGEVVTTVQQSINLPPGDAWVEELPDVSDSGGRISYIVRSSAVRFSIFFFADDGQYESYRQYRRDESPDRRPTGHSRLSKLAVEKEDGPGYEATTKDDGAREKIGATGPYYFVVDYSNYRLDNPVGPNAQRLSVGVDLTVVRRESLL